MTTGLLTAGSGQAWENDLVAALDRPGSPMSVVRRCVDIVDVLATAATGRVAVLVVSADLRRLDSEAVARLRAARVAVVGIYPAADTRAPLRLDRIGVTTAVPDDAGADVVLAAARTAITESGVRAGSGAGEPVVSDARMALPPGGPGEPSVAQVVADPRPPGRVVAVWGPTGAPGRSTVAALLAGESAAGGVPTLLVDADVYGGVLASAFGLLDESPGLAGACRVAANGRLDLAQLSRLVWALGPQLRLLTGITRADRWPEVRPSAIPLVLGVARELAVLTVVDCGFCLEADEEITFDTLAPRRNGATLALLAAADVVVAVGSADPPGMERLVRGLAELTEMLPDARPRVVLNRMRRTGPPESETVDALRRFTGLTPAAILPEDRSATDRAWQRGVALGEVAAGSPLVTAVRALARTLLPVPVGPP